jgi:hypothetical protein
MAEYALPHVIGAIRDGLSANAGYQRFQAERHAAGEQGIRRETWLRLTGEVRAAQLAVSVEITRPQDRRPLKSEIQVMTSKTADGYMQYVDVYVRDKQTGLVEARPFTIAGDSLMTRADAVETAIERYARAIESDPSSYDEAILGAVYMNTYQLVPERDTV